MDYFVDNMRVTVSVSHGGAKTAFPFLSNEEKKGNWKRKNRPSDMVECASPSGTALPSCPFDHA